MTATDDDIDALLGSVLGKDGTTPTFPEPPAAKITPISDKVAKQRAVLETSAALVVELDANEPAAEALDARPIIDPRTVRVRFSRLRCMAASALHYWQAVQDDRPDTIAMRFGRGVHALVLGTPVIRWTGKTRQGKAWEAFKARHADKEILNTKEWDRAHGIFEAIRRHPIANDAIFGNDAILEETIDWSFGGRACTSRPDSRTGVERLVDLKTTRCAEPTKFERDAMWRGYPAQFSFYGHAIRDRFGAFPRESLCVAVEPVKPFAITVLELTPNALNQGEKMWRLWWEKLMVCEASNAWPAYTDSIVKLDVPTDDDFAITIGGEEFDWNGEDAA